ncbi:hypothetical protein [Chelatococcus reniformis]|uniref:Uncharacterized protein n=1 Tax=Chelatococcus reniformis TaxID=1494448 RepID=A0A916U4I5_9HYPH|nr:hypothetical protein [Chelatococcus reniformis]GGC60374.1 hypothetical protein GCM10010994_18760 [Chelatococcus reniformis]
MSAKRDSDGRYTGIHRGSVPGELPKAGQRRFNVHIVHGIVADPNAARPGGKQRVAINARTDALETEYAHKRIDDAAYAAGLRYQRALERTGIHALGSAWAMEGSRSDPADRRDARIVHGLEVAQAAVKLLDATRPVVGMLGERVLVMVLGERLTLGDAAYRLSGGRRDKHVTDRYAWMFRQALELLAEHWVAVGRPGKRG